MSDRIDEESKLIKVKEIRNLKDNLKMATPCKLRRSTQWQMDCRWCGSSRQYCRDTVCDECNVEYKLRLYYESFGHHGLRVFGDFAKNKDWFEVVSYRGVFTRLFHPLGGKLDSASLGWVFREDDERDLIQLRKSLLGMGITNWYSNSELAARVQKEGEFYVDI